MTCQRTVTSRTCCDLVHPARGHPRPRADGVEPEVGHGGGAGLLGHVCAPAGLGVGRSSGDNRGGGRAFRTPVRASAARPRACQDPRVPGTNLTRDEAQARAALVRSQSYDVDLDLTGGPDTFVSRTTARFRTDRAGDDLAGPGRRPRRARRGARRRPGAPPGPRPRPPRLPAVAARPARGRRRGHRRRALRVHEHRRGPAPLRRPGRQGDLPLHAVRGRRLPPRARRVRAARPQGDVRLHRHRARPLAGRLGLPHPGRPSPASTAPRRGASPRRRGCPPTSPRWSPGRTTWSAAS